MRILSFAIIMLVGLSSFTTAAVHQELQELLIEAVRDGDAEKTRYYLDSGAGANVFMPGGVNEGSIVPIVEAIRAGHVEIVQILLCSGATANMSVASRFGSMTTPLNEARERQDQQMINVIVDAIARERDGRELPCTDR